MWPRLVDEISRINASIIGLSRSYNKYLGYIAIPVFRADEMWPFYITQRFFSLFLSHSLKYPHFHSNSISFSFLCIRTPAKSEWKPKSKTSNDDINSMAMWWGTILATQHTRADRKHDNGKYLNNSFAKAVQSASSHYSPSLIDLVIKGIYSQFSKRNEKRWEISIALIRLVSTSYAGQVAADYRQFLLEVSDDHQLNDNTIEILWFQRSLSCHDCSNIIQVQFLDQVSLFCACWTTSLTQSIINNALIKT